MYRRHRYPEMLYGTREARRCNILCDDLDQYEYIEECPDYVKEDEDE